MNAAGRVGLYGAGLVAVLVASTAVAGAIAPEGAGDRWSRAETHADTHTEPGGAQAPAGDGGHGEHAATADATAAHGLAVEQDGYLLGAVGAPSAAGEAGELAFRITDARGKALTDYAVSHGKELHLIVVRADGTHFRHVHPERDADGVWSVPWTWDAAGTYRVYADFVPASDGAASGVTLTRSVHVAGDYAPVASAPSATASVDGFDVTLHGELRAGAATELTAEITRDGEPVTTLEPYLGAFGHLVALREGDLAYLHVHPEGAEPRGDERSGPEVTFVTEAPTEGRYLLYLDFQVDGQVRTAAFAVDTTGTADAPGTAGERTDDETAVGHDGGDHDH
jgi:hypothetical protein